MTGLLKSSKDLLVGMGQVSMVKKPDITRAVLGSCVGLVLYHSRVGVGMLAHIVLPTAEGRSGMPCKFADTAIPHMLQELQKANANRAGLVAKLTGGANMFGGNGPIQIGKANAEAVRSTLKELTIPIVAEHIGGNKGRRVTFDSVSGDVCVEIVGEPAAVI